MDGSYKNICSVSPHRTVFLQHSLLHCHFSEAESLWVHEHTHEAQNLSGFLEFQNLSHLLFQDPSSNLTALPSVPEKAGLHSRNLLSLGDPGLPVLSRGHCSIRSGRSIQLTSLIGPLGPRTLLVSKHLQPLNSVAKG